MTEQPLLAQDIWRGKIFVGGSWRPSARATSSAVIEPATGAELGSIGEAGADDVAAAAESAAARAGRLGGHAVPGSSSGAASRG